MEQTDNAGRMSDNERRTTDNERRIIDESARNRRLELVVDTHGSISQALQQWCYTSLRSLRKVAEQRGACSFLI